MLPNKELSCVELRLVHFMILVAVKSDMASTSTSSERVVSDLVTSAMNAIRPVAEENRGDLNDFTTGSLVEITRRSFQRRGNLSSRQVSEESRSRKRGRKFLVNWRASMFLLRRNNMDFFPSTCECKYLEDNGFGRANLQREAGKVLIKRSWSMSRLYEEIWNMYPLHPLQLVGVKIGHCDKGKKISIIQPESVHELIQKIGRGKILVIPNRDLPIPSSVTAVSTVPHGQSLHAVPTTEVEALQDPRSTLSANRIRRPRALQTVRRVSEEILLVEDEITTFRSENATTSRGEFDRGQSVNSDNSPHPSDIELETPTWTDAGTPSVSLRSVQDNSGIPTIHESESVLEEVSSETDVANSIDMDEIRRAFILLEGTLSTERQEIIIVNRQTMVTDMLKIYSTPDILATQVKIAFIGEQGDDFGGVTKDLFTGLWKKLTEEFFKGEGAVVPYMPLHRQRKEKSNYIAIGRILSHTTALLQILPPRLSRSCILSLVFGGDIVDDALVLKDFYLYLIHEEMQVVQKAVARFESLSDREKEKLTNIFAMFGFLEQPKKELIKEQVLSIARSELIDKPAPLVETIRKGIPQSHIEVFWSALTVGAVDCLFSRQKPTTHKVIGLIETSEDVLRPEEDSCLYYLRQYISSLDQEDLESFLLFVTGSTVLPEKIIVQFSSLIGAGRRLIAHTCSNTLELPTTYTSFQEFKREARALLTNENSFVMNML